MQGEAKVAEEDKKKKEADQCGNAPGYGNCMSEYVMELAECHRQRNNLADVEGKWKDFQDAVRSSAEQSLKGRPKVKKVWLQQNTLELVEQKRLAFACWQEDSLDRTRRQEYNMLAKEVKRAVR